MLPGMLIVAVYLCLADVASGHHLKVSLKCCQSCCRLQGQLCAQFVLATQRATLTAVLQQLSLKRQLVLAAQNAKLTAVLQQVSLPADQQRADIAGQRAEGDLVYLLQQDGLRGGFRLWQLGHQ